MKSIDTLKAECIYDKGLKEEALSPGSPLRLPGCHVFCYYNAGVVTVIIYNLYHRRIISLLNINRVGTLK